MIRLGLIGTGPWGRQILKSTRNIHGLEIVSAFSRSVPDDLGIPVYQDWRDCLKTAVDGVILASHPDINSDAILEFASAGIPVMVEKPLCLTRATAALLEQFIRPDALILVDHIHLFSPAFLRLRDIVLSSGASDIVTTSRGLGPGPERDFSALFDYGAHDVSMNLALNPDSFRVVDCWYDLVLKSFNINLSHAKFFANVEVGNAAREKIRTFRALFNGQEIIYDDRSGIKLTLNRKPVSIPDARPLDEVLTSFALAIQTGRTDWRFGLGIAVEVVSILDQAQSILRGS